jgi:DNA-binding MarR family transcriptional regulator
MSTTKIAAERILRVLEVFRDLGDTDMPIGEAIAFLTIALGQDDKNDRALSVTEVHTRTGYSLSAASRYVQALGKLDRRLNPGLELVSDHTDPTERRRKVLRLTPKGERVLGRIAATATGEK